MQEIQSFFASDATQADILYQRVAQQLLQHLTPITITPDTILDISDSSDTRSSLLMTRFPKATITHFSPMLRGNSKSTTVDRHNSNPYELPYSDAEFDLVIANLIPHWLDDIPRWLMEMMVEVLSPPTTAVESQYHPPCCNIISTTKADSLLLAAAVLASVQLPP